MRKPRAPIGVEKALLEAAEARGSHAATSGELLALSGLAPGSLKDTLIRLSRKKHIAQWRSVEGVNYYVAAKFVHSAYYLEQVKIDPLYRAFGHHAGTITIQRSIPFTLLTDEGVRKNNRYRDQDGKVA